MNGLRGYSKTQMKEMRLSYEGWSMLDANSPVATDELQISGKSFEYQFSVITNELTDIHSLKREIKGLIKIGINRGCQKCLDETVRISSSSQLQH